MCTFCLLFCRVTPIIFPKDNISNTFSVRLYSSVSVRSSNFFVEAYMLILHLLKFQLGFVLFGMVIRVCTFNGNSEY